MQPLYWTSSHHHALPSPASCLGSGLQHEITRESQLAHSVIETFTVNEVHRESSVAVNKVSCQNSKTHQASSDGTLVAVGKASTYTGVVERPGTAQGARSGRHEGQGP